MLILASASVRRKHLLEQAGYDFVVDPAKIGEIFPKGKTPEETVSWLARQKSKVVAQRHPDDVVLAADTIVLLNGKIYGKPHTHEEAVSMLRALSGKEHEVFTGVSLRAGGTPRALTVCTKVRFFDLTDEEIEEYVATGEPFDKAGAYAIQGRGAVLVESIYGDFYNVMGLPLAHTVRMLARAGVFPTKHDKS